MEQHITDECTGLKYELVRDYYLVAGDDELEKRPIGIWGKRFFRLVNELAADDGITETLKAEDQMLWVKKMNAVRETATEIVNNDLIYA